MTKFGIGVGEDFPVDEPPAGATPPETPEGDDHPHRRGGRGGWRRDAWRHRHHHRFGFLPHIILRVAVIGLAIAGLSFLFHAHPYPGPYGYYPYTPHFGFFPALLLIGLAFLVFGHRRHHAHWHDAHWHDGPSGRCRDDREEA